MHTHPLSRWLSPPVLAVFGLFCFHHLAYGLGSDGLPKNLAASAKISASTEFSADYKAANVADGQIPAQGCQADTGQAWCVNGAACGGNADLVFEWPAPVTAGEIVYYARNAWFPHECWKQCALLVDDAEKPLFTATLQMKDGPQRISLPKLVSMQKLTLRFSEPFAAGNPGASEVQIFKENTTDDMLRELRRARILLRTPKVDRADPDKLAGLITRLESLHGDAYTQARGHRRRLEKLRKQLAKADEGSKKQAAVKQDLAQLQREALLFDTDPLVVIRRHEIVASHVYTYHYEGFKAGGGLYVVSAKSQEPELKELATSPTGQILDADISHDGRQVLFSWRQTEKEGYHLWVVDVDGANLRQLSSGPWHDYNGCWLPDGGIAFLSTRTAQFAYCWHAPVGVVYRMDADGGNARKLSANYLNDFTPYVLESGRIIYTRWEYVDRPAIPIQSLWTMNPDGTGLAGFFGNRVISPGTFMEARSIPGTGKIVCTMTGHNGPTRGAIGVIDRSLGDNAQAAIQNITPDTPVPAVDAGNGNTDGSKLYSGPCPLDAERLLVSAQGPLLVRDFSGDCQSLVLAAPENGMQYFNAMPVRPRFRPPVIAPAAPVRPEEEMATVFLQDVYAGLAPQVARGGIKRLRVVREMPKTVRIDPAKRAFGFQFPVISCGATYAAKNVLGEVPVEEDGSACFRVPSGIPVYFMALDAQGRALQRMRTFTHFMPGEQQGCVGCHEPRLQTPPVKRGLAAAKPPRTIEPPEWGAGGFGYARIVQPVLDEHCIQCHNTMRPDGGVDLCGAKTDYFNISYETLAREKQGPSGSPYVSWIPTYNGQEQNILKIKPLTWGSPASKLAELVLNGHPGADGKPRINLDDQDKRRILAWIDLNVPYYDTSETAYPDNEGCRRIYAPEVDQVLTAVSARRCVECHADGNIHRKEWTRITEPELNNFLLAPLAKKAGGAERCGKAVFKDKTDPDYQAILDTLKPLEAMLQKTPRMDMPAAKPAPQVCRDRY